MGKHKRIPSTTVSTEASTTTSTTTKTKTSDHDHGHDHDHDHATTISDRPRRNVRRRDTEREKSLVERVNTLSPEVFSAQYFLGPARMTMTTTPTNTTTMQTFQTIPSSSPTSPRAPPPPPQQQQQQLHLSLKTWAEMAPWCREACLNLIEQTSLDHYRASEMGWSRAKKLKEMGHPAMRYLILTPTPIPSPPPPPLPAAEVELGGFLSFMITEEDGREVIYCYELHLRPRLQGEGRGKGLMWRMEMIGARVGVEKAMLTVFRSNERALAAYRRWGYGADEFSPGSRTLRDGTVREASYVILSKGRGDFAHEESGWVGEGGVMST